MTFYEIIYGPLRIMGLLFVFFLCFNRRTVKCRPFRCRHVSFLPPLHPFFPFPLCFLECFSWHHWIIEVINIFSVSQTFLHGKVEYSWARYDFLGYDLPNKRLWRVPVIHSYLDARMPLWDLLLIIPTWLGVGAIFAYYIVLTIKDISLAISLLN